MTRLDNQRAAPVLAQCRPDLIKASAEVSVDYKVSQVINFELVSIGAADTLSEFIGLAWLLIILGWEVVYKYWHFCDAKPI